MNHPLMLKWKKKGYMNEWKEEGAAAELVKMLLAEHLLVFSFFQYKANKYTTHGQEEVIIK